MTNRPPDLHILSPIRGTFVRQQIISRRRRASAIGIPTTRSRFSRSQTRSVAISVPFPAHPSGAGEGSATESGCPLRCSGRGAWRSLVSALVWGTRGPEFESRRPDQRKPCSWQGFCRSKRVRAHLDSPRKVRKRTALGQRIVRFEPIQSLVLGGVYFEVDHRDHAPALTCRRAFSMCHADPAGSVDRHARSSVTASRSRRTLPNVAVAFFNRASRVAFVFGSQMAAPGRPITSTSSRPVSRRSLTTQPRTRSNCTRFSRIAASQDRFPRLGTACQAM